MKSDTRHPEHWRQAKLCRTADGGNDIKSFMEVIPDHDVCRLRQDDWSTDVEHRVHGALSDLHAADARYHHDCQCNFMSPRSLQFAAAHTSPCFLSLVQAVNCQDSLTMLR